MIGLAPKDSVYIGKGRPVDDPKKGIGRIYLKDAYRQTHLLGLGTTQIGKSYLINNLATQDILKGESVVIIDPKGDMGMLSSIFQAAFATGRHRELIFISPILPEISAKINPFSHHFMAEELVNHVVSGLQVKDEFFFNIAYETTLVIILALLLFIKNGADNITINFSAIKQRCSYAGLEQLRVALNGIGFADAKEIASHISHILESKEEHFSKVSSSLRTILTQLSTGSVGQIIGKTTSNEFMNRLENNERVILYVQTGTMLTRQTAHVVGRVLVSMIQSFVGRRHLSGKQVEPLLSIYLDEFSNVVYKNIADLFNKAAGAGVRLSVFTQSLADITEAIGEDAQKKIVDNCNSKIFMKCNDLHSADYVADSSDRKRRYSPILQLGGGMMIRELEEASILPEDVLNLMPRDFFLKTFDGTYKGRTRILPQSKIKIVMPELLSK